MFTGIERYLLANQRELVLDAENAHSLTESDPSCSQELDFTDDIALESTHYKELLGGALMASKGKEEELMLA